MVALQHADGFDFVADGNGGVGRLSVDGKPAGEARFRWFGAFSSETFGFSSETFDVGSDLGSPVSDDYATPFSFTGKVETVTLDLK